MKITKKVTNKYKSKNNIEQINSLTHVTQVKRGSKRENVGKLLLRIKNKKSFCNKLHIKMNSPRISNGPN